MDDEDRITDPGERRRALAALKEARASDPLWGGADDVIFIRGYRAGRAAAFTMIADRAAAEIDRQWEEEFR
jgi:hypothetical protein